MSGSLVLVAQALEAGAGGSNPSYVNMLWLLLRMRQACSHPWRVPGLRCRRMTPLADVYMMCDFAEVAVSVQPCLRALIAVAPAFSGLRLCTTLMRHSPSLRWLNGAHGRPMPCAGWWRVRQLGWRSTGYWRAESAVAGKPAPAAQKRCWALTSEPQQVSVWMPLCVLLCP